MPSTTTTGPTLPDDRNAYETPIWLFECLAKRFGGFDLDAFATPGNAKCTAWITPESNALVTPWSLPDRPSPRVFANPPYSANLLGKCVRRMHQQAAKNQQLVVGLFPPSTDTRWWADAVMGAASTVYFLTGRIAFAWKDRELNNTRCASCIAVWDYRSPSPRTPTTTYTTLCTKTLRREFEASR